ncbi:MAG: RagB/SusD family nutrient uptake outer membrane protein [Prevotella sp.]|nr:RagB/SusD family nutrient uptake outer membrane protein [Prevotella sp.]MBQ6033149.1 RagB/SusD family nutrient uptake outer membrane protein [Prevotella sp.]MBQ7716339.1 RagB/SusD family nutrient uptake outer membrane protein [Prevotella sp.]MBQ9570610.1 RagB/SusD family nutrient uptake outer membrane protein [Prevotella sp.]
MKTYIYNKVKCTGAITLLFLCLLLVSSCDDQLEITPKGKVTLQSVEELELLLNQEYMIGDMPCNDLGILSGESVGAYDQVSTVLSQTNTVKYALMAFDETINRATLTTNDTRYSNLYKYINYMNTVITKMPDAEGNDAMKNRLIAEARVMRAYLHWLVAGIYAQQYDENSAASKGGIPYVKNIEVTETKEKNTLAETYKQILDDCSDEVIAQLPQERVAGMVMRGDRAWGNAVRAVVLMQMKRYSEALPYAQKAIQLRPQMFDRSVIKETGAWIQDETSDNNFLYIGGAARVSPTMTMLSLETAELFEDGDYVMNYDYPGWSLDYGNMFSGLNGVRMYMGWSSTCNVYGLTSEQLHYIAAECLIRTGKIPEGLELVNDVRKLRIEDCQPFTAASEQEAMQLLQRAKFIECLNTPFNYLDIKRWNTESGYSRTVTHRLGSNGTYSLSPQSSLWVMPFPVNAVRYNPTLTQNY